MSNNCFVKNLKMAVNNDLLPDLEKARIIYDLTQEGATATSEAANYLAISNRGRVEYLDDHSTITNTWSLIQASSDTPANTRCRILVPLTTSTVIYNNLTGNSIPASFTMRLKDLVRMTQLTRLQVNGLKLYDLTQSEYDIIKLAPLVNLTLLNTMGKYQRWWHGDFVEFADKTIELGRDISTRNVLVLCIVHGGYSDQYSVNGVFKRIQVRFIHFEFKPTGYSIYANNDSSAKEDYSGETPLYTKTF